MSTDPTKLSIGDEVTVTETLTGVVAHIDEGNAFTVEDANGTGWSYGIGTGPHVVSVVTAAEEQGMERYAASTVDRYNESVAAIVRSLRAIADEVEREGGARVGHVNADGLPDHLWAAQQVIHAVMWGTANLNLDGLVSAATDAQNAVRGRDK